MKLAFVADVHAANHKRMGGPVEAGLNRRCRQVLAALGRAVSRAASEGCDAIFVAGDLVDTTKPEPQVIAAIQAVLAKAQDPYLLLGNHDQVSEQAGDHALGPFAPIATVVDTPAWKRASHGGGVEVLCVPFQPGDAREWLPKVVAEQCKGVESLPHRVLLLHLGLEYEGTPEYMKGHSSVPVALVARLCKDYGFEAAFSGDWHFHKVLGTDDLPIIQIGTLAPTGFDNPGLEGHGSLVIWDTDTRKMQRVDIPGPRFLKLKDTDPFPKLDDGYDLYVQVTASSSKVAGVVASLDERRGRGLVDGEVMADDSEARAAARTAATVARSAQTMDEALDGYVGQMPLPEGVSREEVLAQAKRYLGG